MLISMALSCACVMASSALLPSSSPSLGFPLLRTAAAFSPSAIASPRPTHTPSACSASVLAASEHTAFVKDAAFLEPPVNLHLILKILQERGEEIISPLGKIGIIPLAIPLTKDPSTGVLTALLRWPTPPEGMEIPVVQVHKYGVSLLAKSVDQYIHRALVEEDANKDSTGSLYELCGNVGLSLYKRGDFANAKMANLEAYLMKKVGMFPDVFEQLALKHLERGDQVSALVTAEFYASKKHFPGFARPFVFNAELMLKVGRRLEAKDAAKVALRSPWWTLGCRYEEVAKIALWGDEQVEYMQEKVTEKGRQEELNKGKSPAQVALDQAAFLLDLAAVDGSWDKIREQLAFLYRDAGLNQLYDFIMLTDSS